MRVLSIDYGTRRIGVALGKDREVLWSKTIDVASEHEALSLLDQLVRSESVDALVFGLPLRMDGSEKGEAVKVRNFATAVSQSTGRPAVFIDERLTSDEAKALLAEQGVPEHEMRRRIDAVVAKILLEQYYRELK